MGRLMSPTRSALARRISSFERRARKEEEEGAWQRGAVTTHKRGASCQIRCAKTRKVDGAKGVEKAALAAAASLAAPLRHLSLAAARRGANVNGAAEQQQWSAARKSASRQLGSVANQSAALRGVATCRQGAQQAAPCRRRSCERPRRAAAQHTQTPAAQANVYAHVKFARLCARDEQRRRRRASGPNSSLAGFASGSPSRHSPWRQCTQRRLHSTAAAAANLQCALAASGQPIRGRLRRRGCNCDCDALQVLGARQSRRAAPASAARNSVRVERWTLRVAPLWAPLCCFRRNGARERNKISQTLCLRKPVEWANASAAAKGLLGGALAQSICAPRAH